IHMAIENDFFTKVSRRPCSKCQPAVPATSKADTKKAATPICASRYGKDGLNTIANQSCGRIMPFSIMKPCGVCIQLLEDKIQNIEIQVPIATIKVAKK